ncbi:putative receptor-type adenylate cyclase GRESAG 4 [Trypanosoma cruzi]|nr:putative receptor-type adenylate cyclase GRESAG 4 [Trypanosoma cruzi]
MGLRFQRGTLLLLGIFFFVMTLDSVGVFASNSKPSEKRTGKPVVSRQQMNKNIYRVAHHALYVLVYLSLSAVFAGLTIGIMCMDTLTIDIIATSGPEPDRTYASQILPLRRQGHQTLCTLILSNMLLNVLVVQETAVLMDYVHELEAFGSIGWAVKENNDVTSFVLSTVLIFIFTEIIPTSICKSKHSLRIAAAGCVLVRIAMVLMYPVAISLGWLLDRFVAHDAGQIYDRNELRKLMILHCEAHGDRSGLVKSEVKLLMAAMEFQERRVRDIMTPVDQTTVVRAEEVITAEVIERLWNCGRSRIPVEQRPQKYIGVLLVKDLLTLPMPIGDRPPITIGELVKAKSRVLCDCGRKHITTDTSSIVSTGSNANVPCFT